jgi:hypothetical protein
MVTPRRIRIIAAKQMSGIFWFHMRVMAVILCLRIVLPLASLPLVFAAFCNAFCLAERFWDVQLCSLVYWHPFCQCCFLVSRLLLVTLFVLFVTLWLRICWELSLA